MTIPNLTRQPDNTPNNNKTVRMAARPRQTDRSETNLGQMSSNREQRHPALTIGRIHKLNLYIRLK